MKSYTAFVLLSFAVTMVSCQFPNAGTCTPIDVTTYIVNNLEVLGADCGVNLNTALYANISSPGKDAQLDTVCTTKCAGNLANWLERECGGTFNATSLYYLCLQTSGTASVGRYCQYTIPPVFDTDTEVLNVFTACAGVVSSGQCTDGCMLELDSFAKKIGCCYQSLYNNTVFVQRAAAIGELANEDVDELRDLGDRTLWDMCDVIPPSLCTSESFPFPTGGVATVLPQLQVLTILMVIAALIGLL